jgi:hypothetical protein
MLGPGSGTGSVAAPRQWGVGRGQEHEVGMPWHTPVAGVRCSGSRKGAASAILPKKSTRFDSESGSGGGREEGTLGQSQRRFQRDPAKEVDAVRL